MRKKSKKGEKLLKILEILAEVGEGMIGFAEAFLRAGYGASAGRIAYVQDKIAGERATAKSLAAEEEKANTRLRNTLYYLEKNGLVKKEAEYGGKWKITEKGIKKILGLREQIEKSTSVPSVLDYQREAGTQLVIVVFDIPEKERPKRDWIRAVLGRIGLKMLQKSVWIGKVKIPRELPEDLKELGLLNAVQILAISKAGNLRQLLKNE